MKKKNYEIVDSTEKLEKAIEKVRQAQKIFAGFTQEQVDKIFLAAATAANKNRIPLAKLAVEETGMGIVEDKVIKNHYEHTGKWIGFKAAGGISTPDEVLKYEQLAERIIGEKQITNQFFRIGASRLTDRLFAFLTQ